MSSMMKRILKVAAVSLLALALVAFFAACDNTSSGSGDDAATGANADAAEHVDDADADADADMDMDGDEAADPDADEHADDAGEDGGAVHVSLSEWSITPAHGEAFEADAGEMVFEIHNEGAAPHDVKVIKTDLAPDALPIVDGIVDQEAAGEVIGGVDPIPSGEIYVEPYNLDEGSYVIICTIPGHYQQGMSAGLTVH